MTVADIVTNRTTIIIICRFCLSFPNQWLSTHLCQRSSVQCQELRIPSNRSTSHASVDGVLEVSGQMNHYKLAKGGVSKTTSSRLLYYGRVCAWYQVPGKTKQSLRIIRRRQWLAKKCWCQFIENASFQASSINLALTWFLLFVRTWYQVPGTRYPEDYWQQQYRCSASRFGI